MATAASNRWAMVDEVYDTGELESVYNLRIADFHTYFVGDADWGFSAWAHNEGTGSNGSDGFHYPPRNTSSRDHSARC